MPADPDRVLVGLALPPGDAFAAALDAAWDRGEAVLPLDPTGPPQALEEVVRALRPDRIVTTDGDLPASAFSVAEQPRRPDPALAGASLVIATSGSTGAPKGVCLSRAALEASAHAAAARLGIGPGDAWVSCLPWHHIGGLQVLLRSRLLGTPMTVAASARDAAAVPGATLVSLVPAQLVALLDAGVDLRHWRAVLLGGAAAPPVLLARATDAGVRVVTTYGMSETSGGCVYDGVPLDGVTVAAEPDGRLSIRGPVLMDGYRLDPAATAEALVDRRLLTRDLGEVDPTGRVRVRGRADDVIVTGGANVDPAAVEAVLASHPAVAQVAVAGRPNARWGEVVVAVVVARGDAPTLPDLQAFVRARAGSSYLPRALVLVDAVPLLPSGKPDRHAVRRLATEPENP